MKYYSYHWRWKCLYFVFPSAAGNSIYLSRNECDGELVSGFHGERLEIKETQWNGAVVIAKTRIFIKDDTILSEVSSTTVSSVDNAMQMNDDDEKSRVNRINGCIAERIKIDSKSEKRKRSKVNGGVQHGKCCESSRNGKIGEVCIGDSWIVAIYHKSSRLHGSYPLHPTKKQHICMDTTKIFQDDPIWSRLKINEYRYFSIQSAKEYTKEGRYAYLCLLERRNTKQRYKWINVVFLFILFFVGGT